MKYTDKQLIDFLEKEFGCALVNDDNGHWALSYCGFQNVVVGKRGQDVQTSFFIGAKEWSNSVRAAIIKEIIIREKENKKKKTGRAK